MAIDPRKALEILAQNRGQRIVITTMASIGVWPELSNTPLDFAYMPSAMGQGPALGLGLALAHPEHGVIVINGDGSMLMNLGSLVTLANQPANTFLVIMDNGLYEVTGGQVTAGTGHTDFAGLARHHNFEVGKLSRSGGTGDGRRIDSGVVIRQLKRNGAGQVLLRVFHQSNGFGDAVSGDVG